jgi:hypothetical protein
MAELETLKKARDQIALRRDQAIEALARGYHGDRQILENWNNQLDDLARYQHAIRIIDELIGTSHDD